MRIFSSARVVLPGCPPDVADKRFGRRRGGVGFLSHLRSLRATTSQKSSVPQAVSFVSQVLKRHSSANGHRTIRSNIDGDSFFEYRARKFVTNG